MRKTASGATLAAFVSSIFMGTTWAAPHPENSTYVDGNVTSLKPNTGGTLVFTDQKTMTFRTWSVDVDVPYANISKAELGATQEHNHDVALPGPLRVLSAPLRHKTETQLLIVEFKNAQGETQTMTLSLAKPAASDVLSTIQSYTGQPHIGSAPEAVAADKGSEKPAVASAKTESSKAESKDSSKDGWWGDSFWKTTRNQDTWSAGAAAAPSATTTASNK